MRKHVLIFGSIAGVMVATLMAVSMAILYYNPAYLKWSMVVGFASMFVSFLFIYVGVRNYRDKEAGGVITFGRALRLGLLIAVVASTFYVVTWLIEYHFFMPDFLDRLGAAMILSAERDGATAAKLAQTAAQMESYKEVYRNPLLMAIWTYIEVLWAGVLMAIVSAVILRKKTTPETKPAGHWDEAATR